MPFFSAYLVFDLFHVLQLYPKQGGIDTITSYRSGFEEIEARHFKMGKVVHHLVFLTCSAINGGFQILPFSFTWLIIGELSTIFLNIRWALIKTGRGNTSFFQLVQYLFALTFFVTRVAIYVYGVLELSQQRDVLRDIVANDRVPGIFMGMTLFFTGAGSVINLMWFPKVLAMAVSKRSKKETKAS